jgi:hypothetical protein
MPFFHLAIDLTEREWVTIEAPNWQSANSWGKKHAVEVYRKRERPSLSKDVEYAHEIEPVEPGEEQHYRIEAHVDDNGQEIKEE